jgi:prepilin-type N-terminal cleavage/methylation domain-containing protein
MQLRSPAQSVISRAGLSLVEVLIAIALLSIALITLMSKVHGCIDTAHVTEYQNAARELAKGMISDIEAGLVEGLFNGAQGTFEDKGYPQITYAVGFGDSSSVGTNLMSSGGTANNRRLFDDRQSRYDGVRNEELEEVKPDSTDTDPTLSEEPYMRVRVVVTFPTADPDRTGSFILERMVPTECTQGASGIQKKKEKDQQAAKANAGKDSNDNGGGNRGGQNSKGATNNKKGTSGTSSGSLIGGVNK